MSAKQILDRIAEQQSQQNRSSSKPRPEHQKFQPEWKTVTVLRYDMSGDAVVPVPVADFSINASETENQLFCVIRSSNHFPPRFDIAVGTQHRGRLSTMMGTRLEDDGNIKQFTAFSPQRAAIMYEAAQEEVSAILLAFAADNRGRIAKNSARRLDAENGPGGSNFGNNKPQGNRTPGAPGAVQRVGKTARDKAKHAKPQAA